MDVWDYTHTVCPTGLCIQQKSAFEIQKLQNWKPLISDKTTVVFVLKVLETGDVSVHNVDKLIKHWLIVSCSWLQPHYRLLQVDNINFSKKEQTEGYWWKKLGYHFICDLSFTKSITFK